MSAACRVHRLLRNNKVSAFSNRPSLLLSIHPVLFHLSLSIPSHVSKSAANQEANDETSCHGSSPPPLLLACSLRRRAPPPSLRGRRSPLCLRVHHRRRGRRRLGLSDSPSPSHPPPARGQRGWGTLHQRYIPRGRIVNLRLSCSRRCSFFGDFPSHDFSGCSTSP
jgi:hypothetical protein